ncbi:hypothetical protein [Archangium primigenium]|uniref:transmembrane-type terpene cyclase n=1 Tax=[Archangium] primigenium TaxID=2792470 RepID=UPI00195CCD9B|nr:hypothetical protein [Archangium primigenium]MBM7113211.1 hypothetical protein [Archangium primigenium]
MLEHILNLKDYTPTELFFFVGGCSLWVVVYIIYIRNLARLKFAEAPLFGTCANFGWEFTWGMLCKTDMGLLLQWCYRIWFLLDLYIFSRVVRFGKDQVQTAAVRRYYVPVMLATAVAWAVGVYCMVKSGLDTPIGATSAYLNNLALSVTYLLVMLRRESVAGYSLTVAFCKMIGTGMNTVFMNIHAAYAHNYFLHFISILTTSIDCLYIYALWRRMRVPSVALGAETAT